MAKRIEAITAYRPRLALEKAVESRTYVERVAHRTTLSPGVIRNVQESEIEMLIDMLREGRPVHTGIGIYTPNIDLDGELEVKIRLDKRVAAALNNQDGYRGRILNKENIGRRAEELVELWNEEHPDDLVE